jgi:hypothetical protein
MAKDGRDDWFQNGFDFALGAIVLFVLVTFGVPVVAFALFTLIKWLFGSI